jgi:hypothetical protein
MQEQPLRKRDEQCCSFPVVTNLLQCVINGNYYGSQNKRQGNSSKALNRGLNHGKAASERLLG